MPPCNPLPKDGLVGMLTPEQEKGLKQIWACFYKLFDEAPEVGHTPVPGEALDDNNNSGGKKDKNDGANAGKEIPKDDAAKERVKAQQELQAAKQVFEMYGSKAVRNVFWKFIKFDHPDNIMLKFLRARKYNPEAGAAMLAACMKWRLERKPDEIVVKGEEGMSSADGFIMQMESGKTYNFGTDRVGRPVIYIHVQLHKTFAQSSKALEDYVLYAMETNRLFLTPPIDKIDLVFDMTGFGLSNMDWKCILYIVKCLEAYYPESLNLLCIHAAPWIFQGIWKILGPMLDPVVRAKVAFTKNADDLMEQIPADHLIKQLGGQSEYKFQYTPVNPGENAKQGKKQLSQKKFGAFESLGHQFDQVTRKWCKKDDANLAEERELLAKKLRVAWFEYEEFFRGKTCYHRAGNIAGNGMVFFSYPLSDGSEKLQVQGQNDCVERLSQEIGQKGGDTANGHANGNGKSKGSKKNSRRQQDDDQGSEESEPEQQAPPKRRSTRRQSAA